ncbi:glycine cleavage system protein H [unidentified eubacterium SCB49]|nr:glycine cleavage system protein H [unidentified eubacterium SCB49]
MAITFLFLVSISVETSNSLPIDKLVHIVFNAALIFLWLLYFYKRGLYQDFKGLFIVFICAVIYGIIIEVAQEQFTTTRMADVKDVVANTIGCLSGLLLFKILKIKFLSKTN